MADTDRPDSPAYDHGTKAGEIAEWPGHSPERVKEMRDHLEKLKEQGVEAIEE